MYFKDALIHFCVLRYTQNIHATDTKMGGLSLASNIFTDQKLPCRCLWTPKS
uniref:Uncharacterized protein n=1 Tax=Anguilla anguilla TaxID=7936 RepID=A0A0E9R111_ANGAN